ncbi:hypothetical protein F2Q70_00025490 [Brassica cretica]|uniref:Uncharacterized protein n=1 Tax=Brassica cretica TaxID=69181 RepID=A0A8S9LIL6_BRACR|nr:hypothetical protein F2Q70_00025490 [Brassica cretica]
MAVSAGALAFASPLSPSPALSVRAAFSSTPVTVSEIKDEQGNSSSSSSSTQKFTYSRASPAVRWPHLNLRETYDSTTSTQSLPPVSPIADTPDSDEFIDSVTSSEHQKANEEAAVAVRRRRVKKMNKCAVLLTITGKRLTYFSCSSLSSSPSILTASLLLFFFRFQLMLGTASSWLGQSLVVFDILFLNVGLPPIVYARLGFQDLVFGVLTSMLSFIARGRLHNLLILFRLLFSLYSRISLQLSSHLWWLSLSPCLPLEFVRCFLPLATAFDSGALGIYVSASWWLLPFDYYYSPSDPLSWLFALVL